MHATYPRVVPADALLQAGGTPSEAVSTALLGYELVGAVLGVFIAYLAYQGYRRNDSRPMLFVSLGFVLALGVPLLVAVLFLVLPIPVDQVFLQVLTQTFEILGLLSIIYGLRL